MEMKGEKSWEKVFEEGRCHAQVEILLSCNHGSAKAAPPKPLLLAFPKQSGEYPVILLFHGYMIPNCAYTQLLEHISSHGYIIVAPQMYWFTLDSNAEQEIEDAEKILNWLPDGLFSYLSYGVRPQLEKVVIAGHSRGGKVAFGLALRPNVMLSALVGIDPVDGTSNMFGHAQQTLPRILTDKPHSFDLDCPTLVIGSGLGAKWNLLIPPCAPEGVNHTEFFSECPGPSYHFVASEFGHMDFLNEDTGPLTLICKQGIKREPMRKFSGGIIVAFLDAVLKKHRQAFDHLLHHPEDAPVKLETPEFFPGTSKIISKL